ncbi:MAG TPA: TetR/AcrR family transcriptional regulator [Blastocatellia bacterium]|nr:TetR/AcrR family transcriptional regulator [Blastocatellia bacterium]
MERDRGSTRDRLIEAAIRLFWEKGYNATGMAELLKAAHVNSGSFYHFFDSKEALLMAVLDWYKENIYPALLQPAFENTDDPIERIFALLERYRGLILQTDCAYGCPIGRLALEIGPEQRAVHQKIAENFSAWTAAVRKCLDDAADRLPPGVDRDNLATLVLSVMEGGVMQSRSHHNVEPFDQSVEQLRDYFKRLLEETNEKT